MQAVETVEHNNTKKSGNTERDYYQELVAIVRGRVFRPNEKGFDTGKKVFNSDVESPAILLVQPLDAQDVSKIVLFCRRHNLSPSVKSGGYGTAGWSIGGDVIIDMALINAIDIEEPLPNGGFTSMTDPPVASSPQAEPISHGGQRRRTALDAFGPTSDEYLADPPLPTDAIGLVSSAANAPPARHYITTHDRTDHRGNRQRLAPRIIGPSALASDSSSGAMTNGSSSGSGSAESVGKQDSSATSTPPTSSGEEGYSNHVSPETHWKRPSTDPFGYILLDPGPSTQSIITRQRSPPLEIYQSTFMPGFQEPPSPAFVNAYVTFGAGANQKDVDIFCDAHPLPSDAHSIPYHVPFSAHPVGSTVMMLGGFGFLSRLHGLSLDNLVEVEFVTPDGEILYVSENNHQDLWWALRGAGPAFGIATRYKTKAYPVPVVYAGSLIYPFDQHTTPSLMKHFRDCVKNGPRELYANIILTAGPPGEGSLTVIQICYIGPREKGIEILQVITSWDGDRCMFNDVGEKSFIDQQESIAKILRGQDSGRKWFIRSDMIASLSDETIHATVEHFETTPKGCTWIFELAGGAVADTTDSCLPLGQRQGNFTVVALHQWAPDDHDPRCVTSAEDWIHGTIAASSTGGPLPCLLERQEKLSRTKGTFGENWGRLHQLKQKYDPTGLFKHNFWPADSPQAEGGSTPDEDNICKKG